MDSPNASRRFLRWLALSFALVCAAAKQVTRQLGGRSGA